MNPFDIRPFCVYFQLKFVSMSEAGWWILNIVSWVISYKTIQENQIIRFFKRNDWCYLIVRSLLHNLSDRVASNLWRRSLFKLVYYCASIRIYTNVSYESFLWLPLTSQRESSMITWIIYEYIRVVRWWCRTAAAAARFFPIGAGSIPAVTPFPTILSLRIFLFVLICLIDYARIGFCQITKCY